MVTTTTTNSAARQRLDALQTKYTDRWSTHSFKMEYDGYLSNHLLHALAALTDLGAKDSQVEKYADSYVEKLCVVEDRARDELAPSVLIDEALALRGKRENFEGLRAMYESEIKALSADGAIARHLPNIVGGLAGSLLHGIIQLGYGYHVGGDLLVAEGLAYLHFSYLSFDIPDDQVENAPEITKPFTREAAFELAHAVQKDTSLVDKMRATVVRPEYATLVQGNLQRRLMSFSNDPVLGNPELFSAVRATVDQFDFSEINGATALDFAMWLYFIAPQNDFVLLHAITSAWSLYKVEHLLQVDTRARAWKTWFRMALSAFIMHEVPPLPVDDPTTLADDATVASLPSWDELNQRALALEGFVDEHVYKLVQVAQDVATQGDLKSTFLTPTQREFVAKSASVKVISTDFAAGPPPVPGSLGI